MWKNLKSIWTLKNYSNVLYLPLALLLGFTLRSFVLKAWEVAGWQAFGLFAYSGFLFTLSLVLRTHALNKSLLELADSMMERIQKQNILIEELIVGKTTVKRKAYKV